MNTKQTKELMKALDFIVQEKGISKDYVVEALESAIANAYKKEEGITNVKAKFSVTTGELRLFTFKTVVEEVNNEALEISLTDARKIVDDIELGETIDTEVKLIPESFGRVAAGTAKQIVVQKIKEAEKNLITEEFQDKEGELLVGTLSREDSRNYYVDLGKTHGVLPKDEIIPGEQLVMGSSIKCYVSKVELSTKGVFILLSRSHYGYLKRLLELEIPELSDGSVVLYSVAREAGSRSKVAVYSENDKIDPIGAIVGEKGNRINRVLAQLNGEKIDVVKYDKDPIIFIQNALSPAKDLKVVITDEKKKEALVVVNEENSSLAIGKKGQNVKLASRLTKYKLTIKKENELNEE